MVAAQQLNTHDGGLRVITKETLKREALDRHIQRAQAKGVSTEVIEQLHSGTIPYARMVDFNSNRDMRLAKGSDGQTVAEFIGAGSLPTSFFERQRFEVQNGRDMEPMLYPAIYMGVQDATLPEMFTINQTGPVGAVFERIDEGGEVKFASLGSSTKSVTLYQYAAGIEYSDRIFRFNQLFRLPFIERQFGQAFNALMNHIHFNPILTYSYGASNQTAASSTGTTLVEKMHNTFDSAIQNSRDDSTWPRRGPYTILCASANLSTIRRAVERVPQQGFQQQSPEVFDNIRAIIAYDGWTGTRGKKSTTYSGVTANKAYLISLSHMDEDLQSYVQQPLRMQRGDGDLSRFIVEQVIWDTWFGVYASPRAAVEEVTLPTS